MPENVEHVSVAYTEIVAANDGSRVKLDKLLAKSGLASSVSDAVRKIKANSVRIDGEVKSELFLTVKAPAELTVRVGRQIKKVSIS